MFSVLFLYFLRLFSFRTIRCTLSFPFVQCWQQFKRFFLSFSSTYDLTLKAKKIGKNKCFRSGNIEQFQCILQTWEWLSVFRSFPQKMLSAIKRKNGNITFSLAIFFRSSFFQEQNMQIFFPCQLANISVLNGFKKEGPEFAKKEKEAG